MLTAPKRKPQEFGFKEGDYHIIVNAESKTAKIFDFHGVLEVTIPCRAQGMTADWTANSGDTPPGLYRLGAVYADYEEVGDQPGYDRTLMAYGWYSFDLVDLEGNEDDNFRAGLMAHGGGSGNGWPGAWANHQKLLDTLGCLRFFNSDLRFEIMPRYRKGTIFLSVWQDDQ
jgi:hypothetical protein